MQKYIVQRLLLTIPTVILTTLVIFTGLRVALPTSAVDLILEEYGRNDAELYASLEEQLGLSSSIPEQYAIWTGVAWFWGEEPGILQGNLGESLHSGRPVLKELERRLPVSFELGLWAMVTSVAISVPLGVWAALRQDQWPDYGLRSVAIGLAAVPNFWIAVLVITFGSLWFGWAPPLGFEYFHEDPLAHIGIMVVPAVIIALTPSGSLLRLVRTQMLEVLRQDYVRTAQAKGLSQRTVLYRHALRNALIPVVTVIGTSLPTLISGTVVFEQIFVLPGMGRYLVEAINNLDYPVIQGLTLMFSILLMYSVLLVDLSYAFLDPRIRYQ
jgi:peptide/nickel transport system permease protein